MIGISSFHKRCEINGEEEITNKLQTTNAKIEDTDGLSSSDYNSIEITMNCCLYQYSKIIKIKQVMKISIKWLYIGSIWS